MGSCIFNKPKDISLWNNGTFPCTSVGIGHCPIPSIGLLDFGPNGLSPLQLQFQMDYNFVILVKFPLILAKIIIPAQIKPYIN